MWDSFTSGVAISSMINSNKKQERENEFADMEYTNITVITSNEPFGICDGSNPFFDGLKVPKFNLKKGGVHSGHVQQGLRDQFCFVKNGKGRCQVLAFIFGFSFEIIQILKHEFSKMLVFIHYKMCYIGWLYI